MIGLSVSSCVLDIVEGKVAYEDVEKILGGTRVTTLTGLERLLNNYSELYWDRNPDACVAMFRRLQMDRKLEQPRITRGMAPDTTGGHWVTSMDQIKWVNVDKEASCGSSF